MKLGIIGGGMMGEAILSGILSSSFLKKEDILVSEPLEDRRKYLTEKYEIEVVSDNVYTVNSCEYILLAIKPQNFKEVLQEISPHIKSHHVIISIAAGVSIKKISKLLKKNLPIIRVMTNTPCMVKSGMSVLCGNEIVTPYQMNIAKEIFSSVGEVITLQEKYFDAVTGLSGSGPGFLFLIAETLIDAGVLQGLPRDVSRKLVIETMLGSSLLLKKSDKHPAPLKDMVTSPGGTTISGIQVMEEYKVRAALLKVVEVATKKSKELGEL